MFTIFTLFRCIFIMFRSIGNWKAAIVVVDGIPRVLVYQLLAYADGVKRAEYEEMSYGYFTGLYSQHAASCLLTFSSLKI